VHGEITAELPDADQTTVKTPQSPWTDGIALFSYRGAYRRGENSEFRFGYDSVSDLGIGSQVGKCVGGVKYRGYSSSSRQTIRFNVELKTPDSVEGQYESQSPADRGSFVMRRLAKNA
jgi:hypothetical protein